MRFSDPRSSFPLILGLVAASMLQVSAVPADIATGRTFRLKSYIENSLGQKLCAAPAADTERSAVSIAVCDGGDNRQLWSYTSSGEIRHYTTSYCLDVGSGLILGTAESSDDANPIQIYRCTGKRNQGWVVHQNASVVSNAAPNGCLDLAGGTDYAFPGRNLQSWKCVTPFDPTNGNQARLWAIDYASPAAQPLSTGAIIGIVLGALAAVALIAFGIWYGVKKTKEKEAKAKVMGEEDFMAGVEDSKKQPGLPPPTRASSYGPEPVRQASFVPTAPPIPREPIDDIEQLQTIQAPQPPQLQQPTRVASFESSTAKSGASIGVFSQFGGNLARGDASVAVKASGIAIERYLSTQPNQIELRIGDSVYIDTAYVNGWAVGTNQTTRAQGLFPADFVQLSPARVTLSPVPAVSPIPPVTPIPLSPRIAGAVPPTAMAAIASPAIVAPPSPAAYDRQVVSPIYDPLPSPVPIQSPEPREAASPVLAPMSPPMTPASAGSPIRAPSDLPKPPCSLGVVEQPTMALATITLPTITSKILVQENEVTVDRENKLGEGQLGPVYTGVLRGSTKVAVKVIKKELNQRALNAFAKEVQQFEGLVQRNVLPIMAFSLSPPMIVTDFMEAGNLRQYLDKKGWDQPLGRKLLTDVAAGMTYIHSFNILHGDLKSSNVLIDGIRAVITDFGMIGLEKSLRTDASGWVGSPAFAAPELLVGGEPSTASDVYSYGMLCYEVVSKGRYPFDDLASSSAIIYAVSVDKKRPEKPHDADDVFWALIEFCWAQDPHERPDFAAIKAEMVTM